MYSCFENLFEPIVVVDSNLHILYSNQAFLTLTNLSLRKLGEYDNLSCVICPKSMPLNDMMSQAMDKKAKRNGPEDTITIKTIDESAIRGVISVSPYLDNYIVCINNLNELSVLHQKYKDAYQHMVTADKLTTLGELSASISHEIANPLTIASGGAEIIEMCLDESDLNQERQQIDDSIHSIIEAHKRIDSIIVNMKKYLHAGPQNNEYFSAREVIQSSLELTLPEIKKHQIELQTVIDDAIEFYGNKMQIEQVIVNLIKNAIYALNKCPTRDLKLSIAAQIEDKQGKITVTDNGPGIPRELRDQIFTEFFTTKELGSGTGMGLSIAQKILKTHGGSLSLDDQYENGAQFIVTLPIN